MGDDFLHTTLGRTGLRVHRVGLSATYRPGKDTIYHAIEEGLNYFFCFGLDTHMIEVLREEMPGRREKFVIATGAYNLLVGHPNIERTLEKRLRQLRTDYIDVFMYLGVTKEKHFPPDLIERFHRLKDGGKVRFIGLSTHARTFAGRLAAEGLADVLMVRYNAAHRGAEEDTFPFLQPRDPGVTSFTATRWRRLTRRPSTAKWPADVPVPTPGQCYRFVLSNPAVHVCLMAPSNIRQYYSAKLGFYAPGQGLNNGLIVGADGLTEFLHYPILLALDIDLYLKKTIDIFDSPKPDITDQQILLFPIHLNAAYRLADIPDADTRIYGGAGFGYYLSLYSVTYNTTSGGGGLLGGGLAATSATETKNGGKFFGTLFLRLMIGSVFAEPRLYLAPPIDGTVDGHSFHVRPSGFSVVLGFQYH